MRYLQPKCNGLFWLDFNCLCLVSSTGIVAGKNPRFDEKELKSGVTNVADGKEGAKGVYFNG